jgi:hypothetical protein
LYIETVERLVKEKKIWICHKSKGGLYSTPLSLGELSSLFFEQLSNAETLDIFCASLTVVPGFVVGDATPTLQVALYRDVGKDCTVFGAECHIVLRTQRGPIFSCEEDPTDSRLQEP